MILRILLWMARPVAEFYHRHVLHLDTIENDELKRAIKILSKDKNDSH